MRAADDDRPDWEWEPWEARRASLPRRSGWDARDARESARLLLMVVAARLAERAPPFEHAGALADAAEDERLTPRLRLRAAEALARLRMAGMGPDSGKRVGRVSGPARDDGARARPGRSSDERDA